MNRRTPSSVPDAEKNLIPVVISWCDLPDGNWRDLLQRVALLAHPPLVIVSYRPKGRCLWSEVLQAGGYDVLLKPFDPLEVFRLVTLASHRWQDEANLRKLPAISAPRNLMRSGLPNANLRL